MYLFQFWIYYIIHDTELLNMEILRKNQVYFVDKNKRNGVSELFNLTELPVRINDNIRKAYLVGNMVRFQMWIPWSSNSWSRASKPLFSRILGLFPFKIAFFYSTAL